MINRNYFKGDSMKREILDKYWQQYRVSIGLQFEPMSEKAIEYFEKAMDEYAEIIKKIPQE
jgi:hypothetical protein